MIYRTNFFLIFLTFELKLNRNQFKFVLYDSNQIKLIWHKYSVYKMSFVNSDFSLIDWIQSTTNMKILTLKLNRFSFTDELHFLTYIDHSFKNIDNAIKKDFTIRQQINNFHINIRNELKTIKTQLFKLKSKMIDNFKTLQIWTQIQFDQTKTKKKNFCASHKKWWKSDWQH